MTKEQERREYFRIKNWIIINHDLVDSIESSEDQEKTIEQTSPRISLLQELTRIDNENQKYLGSLNDKQSQLGNYLLNLNKKVDFLTRFVIQSLENENQELTEVDISGGGIRFATNQPQKIDQLLKLEIVLIPECVGLVTYGRVVDCKPLEKEGTFDVALIFVQLREADRDAIIKHVFTLQSKQLRDEST